MSIEQRGGALVVREGVHRLRWNRSHRGFTLAGLWPEPAERDFVSRQIEASRPLLVLFDREMPVVSVLSDELDQLPPGLTVLADDRGVVDLEVPMLDWLPQPLRERGLRFAARAAATEAATPVHQLPPLLVETGAVAQAQVRFARRTRTPAVVNSEFLDAAVSDLFGSPLALSATA